jgi:hypothetical protein
MAHPEQFTKPRAVTTDYGKLGRRTVSNVDVADDELLIQWALDNAHLDCIRVTRAPVKPAIAERLRAGQAVPGCSLVTGEEAFYTVAKALLEDAAAESAA